MQFGIGGFRAQGFNSAGIDLECAFFGFHPDITPNIQEPHLTPSPKPNDFAIKLQTWTLVLSGIGYPPTKGSN